MTYKAIVCDVCGRVQGSHTESIAQIRERLQSELGGSWVTVGHHDYCHDCTWWIKHNGGNAHSNESKR